MERISETHNCDCMEYMRTLPDKYFALAIADPPYGLQEHGAQTGGMGKLKNRVFTNGCINIWDKSPDKVFFTELRRISKNVIVWGGNYFDLPPTRCFVCWDKVQPWENFSQVEYAWTSFSIPSKLFKFDNRTGKKIHPTQKPTELYGWLLQQFAKPGDIIFDPMMGSQSSRIAAYKMGFDYYGCELDADYYKAGCERFECECLGTQTVNNVQIIQKELF